MQIQRLIVLAYGLKDPKLGTQLLPGAPKWLLSDWYDIRAVTGDGESGSRSDVGEENKAEYERLLLQNLLADRFHLRVRLDQKPSLAYDLVPTKEGPKNFTQMQDQATETISWPDWGHGRYHAAPVSDLTGLLTDLQGAPVIDKTGLAGRYDFELAWARDPGTMPPGETSQEMEARPSISSALQQQLGLKLVKTLVPTTYLVIEHIERPEEN